MELQEHLKAIRERNTEVVAVSTDGALEMNLSIRELGVRFPLISDPQQRVIRQFGVPLLKDGVARPTTVLIDLKGIVRLVYVGTDFSDRPSIRAILQALAWL
ncbi:MAG: peroxiredoxin family protein [Candidatus Tectomicrobia bacterium]|uniref:Peroxiredoxin family protein n=1 Tax=Tectimicrobiota bacterium TaxID=2528274 RepID=A0A932HXZ0_UNCTE|nr:peroxiredoxin family protein [Candidatus Tectomicrobia bacterium]